MAECHPEVNIAYANGRVAVLCSSDGNKRFFSESGELLANFDYTGVGFASETVRGVPQTRLVTTRDSGILCGNDGGVKERWMWNPGKRAAARDALKRPVAFALNSFLSLECTGRYDMNIRCRMGTESQVVYVGQPNTRSGCYLDLVVGTQAGGHLLLELPADKSMTLVQRQSGTKMGGADSALAHVQKLNRRLPLPSKTGIEYATMRLRPELAAVEKNLSSIRSTNTTLRARPSCPLGADAAKAPEFATDRLTGCPVTRRGPPGPKAAVSVLRYKGLQSLVAGARADQLIVAMATTRNTGPCREGEKMMTRVQNSWLSASAAAAATTTKGAALTRRSLPQADVEAALDALPTRIVLVDCFHDNRLGEQHAFSTFPMYLMYYNGRLVTCSERFAHFGCDETAFEQQLVISRQRGNTGQYLPDGFAFPRMGEATLLSCAALG